MLTKEMKENWIAALRSGDYKQGKVRLQQKDRFCCLGVLCHLNRIEIGLGHDNEAYDWLAGYISNYNINTLWQMNDINGKTFPEIADWIEENL